VEAMRGVSAQLIRYTRNWLHYGMLSLVVLCALVAAVESFFGR
jgi:hypothetical protein